MAVSFDALNPDDLEGPPIRVTMADGAWYTCHCDHCGLDNGIWIETPTTPVPQYAGQYPEYWTDVCIRCSKAGTHWVPIVPPDT